MKHGSLESSHRGGSDDYKSIFLTSIDDELDLFERTQNISSSSDWKMVNLSSLESFHRCGSNGSKIAFLPLIDSEILKRINMFFLMNLTQCWKLAAANK